MVILAAPVRRPFQSCFFEQEDVLRTPFPFMLGAQAIFSSASGALLHGIRLLNHTPQKVHVPAYCCRSVLLPIEKLKIGVRFYDVNEHLEPLLNRADFSKGDLFLLVHYFGISQDTAHINQLCQEFEMVLVEDCAHTLPDPEAEHPMGSTGAFSIYSLRKQLPVPDGGVLIVNDSQIKKNIGEPILPALRRVSPKRWFVAYVKRFAFATGWPNIIYWRDVLRNNNSVTVDPFYSYLSDGAISEISYVTLHVLSHTDIGTIAGIRRKNYCYMSEQLLGLRGVRVPFSSLPDGAVPQAFPVLLKDADRVCSLMRRKGIDTWRWPGHNLIKSISRTDFPGTFSWADSLLLFPLHQDLNNVHMDKVIKTLKSCLY